MTTTSTWDSHMNHPVMILVDAALLFACAVCCGVVAAILIVKALRLAAELGRQLGRQRRHRRQAAEDARLAEHVDLLLEQRMVRQIEPDTVVMPRLSAAETQLFAPYEQQMAPVAQYYLFDERPFPINHDGRHHR